jgi:hypothetical protein
MVYLVRTCKFLKDWEKAWQSISGLSDHLKKDYKEVKDSYFLSNIAGPIDELHWVLEFESLAEEERFAAKAMKDEAYGKAFMEFEGRLTPFVDRLYRRD